MQDKDAADKCIAMWCNICNTCNAYCTNPVGCKINLGGRQNSPPCLFDLQVVENIQIASLAMIAAQVLLESKNRLCVMPIQGKMFSEEGGTFLCEMDYRYFACKHPIVVIVILLQI